MAGELKHCSQHPLCKGPSLVPGHNCELGPLCDNDQCWVPCPFCITEDAKGVPAALRNLLVQIEDTEEHGAGAHDDSCAICIAMKDASEALARHDAIARNTN